MKTALSEQDVNDLGHMYYGYYIATRDHRRSMEFMQAMGYYWDDILAIRRWASQAMKLDGIK